MDRLDDLEVVRLSTMSSGALVTQIISAAASLGIADALGADTATTAELAEQCGANPDSLGRLLRGLASLGLLEHLAPDLYALTDLGHLLRTDHPRSLRAWCIVQGQLMAPLWGGLLDAVRSGRPAAQEVFGRSFYGHLEAHPELDEQWNRAMAETAKAWWAGDKLLNAVDMAGVTRVVDVGGGQGGLLALLLQHHPHLQGVVYDLPHVVAKAPAFLAAAGVADRAETVAGDFFKHVPPGADLYLLGRVVFNWDDERALRILEACRRAMSAGSLLLVIDQAIPDDDQAHPAKVNDLNLLTMGGRVRSHPEWLALVEQAGLTVDRRAAFSAALPWLALTLRRDMPDTSTRRDS